MCFGSAPQAPTIKYEGPSREKVDANQKALDAYRQQVTDQQTTFTKQLQDQIDAANTQAASLREQFDRESAAASAAAAAQQTAAIAASAAQTEAPADAQVTSEISKKPKPDKTLRIGSNAMAVTPGTGLNVGV